MSDRRYDAVLFDLLTALLDSWSLWDAVAGSQAAGRAWRMEYLDITYQEGKYRPYETLVAEAAVAVGLDPVLAERLADRYSAIQPWPEATETLRRLRAAGVRLALVTNCSKVLGDVAAARLGVEFDAVVTAEQAGYYKPHPAPYRLAIDALGVAPSRCLFVAGSSYDLAGAAAVGLPVFWHDRIGMPATQNAGYIARERSLRQLGAVIGVT